MLARRRLSLWMKMPWAAPLPLSVRKRVTTYSILSRIDASESSMPCKGSVYSQLLNGPRWIHW